MQYKVIIETRPLDELDGPDPMVLGTRTYESAKAALDAMANDLPSLAQRNTMYVTYEPKMIIDGKQVTSRTAHNVILSFREALYSVYNHDTELAYHFTAKPVL